MKSLNKIFRKRKGNLTACENKFQIIREEAEFIHEILGISDKRANELLAISYKTYDDHDKLHSCLERLVSHCKHTNEIVFATLVFQKIVHRKQAVNEIMNELKYRIENG
jgi:hypothetical protein